MTLLQYAAFTIYSDVGPDRISEALGVEPDQVSWRGSRSTDPVLPVTNIWSVEAHGTTQADELVAELLDRLEPLTDRLAVLAADGARRLGISLVRYFDTPSGTAEALSRDTGGRFTGASPEGFHLDLPLLTRMIAFGCDLDVDEYDSLDNR